MRTISKNLKLRLLAQAEEANFHGLEKVAMKLNHQVNSTPIRQDTEEYSYSRGELYSDVEDLLWRAAVRTQDYFGKTADAGEIGEIIESLADELISTLRTKIGGDVVIGPHEPLVPGEQRMIVEIDEDA
jgi:hypothetical protein